MTFEDVEFDSTTKTDTTISNGTLTATGSGSYNAKCQSIETLADGKSITLTTSTGNSYNFISGLGKDPYASSYDSVEYGFHVKSAGYWAIYENGSGINLTSDTFSASDVAKITVDYTNLNVKYYLNGVLKRTKTINSTPLYVHFSASAGSINTFQTDDENMQITSSGGGSGGSGSGGEDPPTPGSPDNTDGSTPLEHILFLNTVVPK